MYLSYLSSHQLRPYLELVIGNGLLEYDSTKKRYRTTERGLTLLDLYISMSGLELAPHARTPTQKQGKEQEQTIAMRHDERETSHLPKTLNA
jgi:hypothetical protein